MAVAFIAGNGAGSALVATLDTGTFTVGSQTDKAMIAIVTWSTPVGVTVSGVAWDPTGVNQSFTSVAAAGSSGNRRVQAFRLINPSAVTNGIVRVTLSGDTVGTLGLYAGAFSGADQTTPAQDFNSASGTSTTPSVTISNAVADDMVMDSFMAGASAVDTIGANQTAIGTETTPGDLHHASYQDGADGGVMSWTNNISAAWLTGGVRIVASAAGTTIAPGLGSVPQMGRVLSLGHGIGMPDVP